MTDPLLWSLLAVQILLGAGDTLYHHELKERLAWRPSQARELRLHGARNLLYAGFFLVLAWLEPRGFFAIALIAVLAVEAGLTLWDFVEEDRTRRLPASERVLHAIMALNFGAILVLLLPVLITLSGRATALSPVSHGLWSLFLSVAALAVATFGLRDLVAAGRAQRLSDSDPADLMEPTQARRHVLVTGATGFIGRRLVAALVARGQAVTVLTREAARATALPMPRLGVLITRSSALSSS